MLDVQRSPRWVRVVHDLQDSLHTVEDHRDICVFFQCKSDSTDDHVRRICHSGIPGQNKSGAITLERGVTYDTEFEQWANKVRNNRAGTGEEVSLNDFRKEIIIEVYNEAGQLALSYKVFRCWVSEYQALPDLDENANAVAIQHIKLENEGWERD